jgi:hypothetical protein
VEGFFKIQKGVVIYARCAPSQFRLLEIPICTLWKFCTNSSEHFVLSIEEVQTLLIRQLLIRLHSSGDFSLTQAWLQPVELLYLFFSQAVRKLSTWERGETWWFVIWDAAALWTLLHQHQLCHRRRPFNSAVHVEKWCCVAPSSIKRWAGPAAAVDSWSSAEARGALAGAPLWLIVSAALLSDHRGRPSVEGFSKKLIDLEIWLYTLICTACSSMSPMAKENFAI